MSSPVTVRLAVVAVLITVFSAPPASSRSSSEQTASWTTRSNAHAQVLLEVLAKIAPEEAGRLGVEGLDTAIRDLSPGFVERHIQALRQAQAALANRLRETADGYVRQDLQILLARAELELERRRLERQFLLPFVDVAEVVYTGIRALLEDRIPRERRSAALVRLKRYAGRSGNDKPLAELAQAYLQGEWVKQDGRLAPYRGAVERSLGTSDRYLKEIGALFSKYGLEGYEADLRALGDQIAAYDRFVRKTVLPRTRTDFRLPDELYAFRLAEHGIDMPLDELRRRAAAAFEELQGQMQALAFRIADARGLTDPDYRAVLRALKKEQLGGEAILAFYEQRLAALEDIIERERTVTLPDRAMRIRLATEAESAAMPGPFLSPPRLIGNTGEYGEFVLPVRLYGGSEGASGAVNDFTYQAAAWPLAAHEGRPGHDLQFATMIEQGVSQARALFSRNSVNVEGWALYMEEQVFPYLPLEGQFTTLWSGLVGAARAVLDPALNTGSMTIEEARRVLREELVLSAALARSELERYTIRAPGQAASYYNGYLRMMELRAAAEWRLGDRFDKQAFHDFVLKQGLLPPKLLREAVRDTFVPTQALKRAE